MQHEPSISLVIPVCNEEENLAALHEEIVAAMDRIGRAWEAVYVDDGSTDAGLALLERLASEDGRVRVVAFEVNCGQSAAFWAGFEHARAPVVVTMDADRQNDPADIPPLLAAYDAGHEMVVGWRKSRRDTLVKRLSSRLANAIRNRLTAETIHDTGCSLKVMDRGMLLRLPRFKGMHRFLPTLMRMQGARVAEVPVHHRARAAGVSKYGTLDRALAGVHDLLGVRWLLRRHFHCRIRKCGG